MKKNAMLKIAAVLLVAVLLTTCAISSTFAKYVSEANTKEIKARVAQWGLNVETSNWYETSFSNKYGEVVNSSNGDKLIAPGTSGTLKFDYTITGTAEVDAEVVFTVETNIPQDLAAELKFYDKEGNLTDLATIENEVENMSIKYKAGQNATSSNSKEYTWMWAFEDGAVTDGIAAGDADDTKLGKQEKIADLAEVSIKITAQVVQVGLGSSNANNYPG